MLMQPQCLDDLSAEQLREMTTRLLTELRHSQALNAKLTHENALLKRMKFAAQSERFNAEQRSLLEDEIEADLAAVAVEIEQLQPPSAAPEVKQQPKRQALPAHLPRREIRHEPESTTCACGCQMKRIGEDVAEKLDYVPGVFTVERHIRGKWACAQCETIIQAPVEAHVIDKAYPPPACWPRCWWPSTPTTCPCTARKASLRAPGWLFLAPPWRNGSAPAAWTATPGRCLESPDTEPRRTAR